MTIYQRIIFHHASCYIININLMTHMYCVMKGGGNLKMITCKKLYKSTSKFL